MSESSTYPEQIAMGPYQYWNLQEKGWVRILSIEPSRMLADPIRASLLHQSLSDLEERGYEALSYCWGKANATCAISIDGASFLVRPNLLSALRRLRRRASRGRRLVWVDAICTNQGDIAERNRQVSQMHQIFSKASRVVVWLDEGGPRTDFAVDTLQQWAAPAKQIEDRWRVRVNTTTASLQGFYDDWTLLYQSLQDRDGRPFFHTCLVEVLWLFQCDWWNRMWTMQELVLAREALVQVGSKTVPWSDFETVAKLFTIQSAHTAGGGAASVGGVYTSLVASFFNMAEDLRVLRAHRSANIPISLSFVLQYTSARLATDARDKVYAGLAIVDWEETQEALRADYNLSCREVYTSAIKTLLAESGDLRAYNFLLGTPPGGGGEFPSWVPSFAADVVRQPDLCFLGGGSRGDFMVTASKGRLYLAGATPALDMKHELRFEGRDKIMAIKGVLIDSLQSIGDAAPQDDGVTDNLEISIAGAIQQWRALVGSLDGHYPTVGPSERRESKKEAFWRTVTLDCKVVFYHAGLKLHNNPRDMRRRLNSPTDAKIPPRTPSEERELLAALDEQVRWKEGQQVGRRFFTTRRGFMGIGPPEAQAGDVVCVFLGGETPFVLRPGNGGRYKLLRQCYLHGFMMGEAIAHACHTGILRLEEIKLE